MRGLSRSHAAITIVNALPTGVGAAVGIDLTVTARATVAPAERAALAVDPPDSATPVVREAVREALGLEARSPARTIHLAIASEIPPAVGLKSSSAVASAVVGAVAAAIGERPGPEAVARLAAAASRRAGVSATGAFDDALAGVSAGVVVTDNARDALLRRWPVGPGLGVVLWVPDGRHPPAPELHERFRRYAADARRAADAATAGRCWEAMRLNTELVDAVMGYDRRELARRLRAHGAVATGTSGLGPALAAVGPRERLSELAAELRGAPGTVREVAFAAPAATEGGP
ncbi:MAG TPA: shikimate kinase [Thermoplasmata archaeon]|nr:shikimate kinase [Thermoplasmata archaeon]